MKTKLLLAFLVLSLTAAAAPKIKTQHFEINDSIRFFDKEDPQGVGFKFNKSFSADWPVTVNGKKSKALNEFLMEEVFYASHNKSAFPNCPDDVKVLKGYVKKWVHDVLRENTMVKEYIVKEASQAPNITDEDYPMSCWYEAADLKVDHCVGDVVFFVENGGCYYGGAHGDFSATFLAFDTALDRPVRLTDVITNTRKLLRLLPRYDHRDKDNKMWDNMDAVDLSNFYVKDGKMVFVFQPYAVGPFCDGIVEVPVPLKTLKAKKLLTTYGQKLFK